ncbi:hypothetical protein HK100_007175 [Physocladia obscura]|uniref:Uncharacterized protein n=1 Tax=Physocladia obscura TaxID=109957 RepID=A0AAD5TAQ4_9FUNG|nr:hypothetical protein HK100_007175 [Physocladia obscura]
METKETKRNSGNKNSIHESNTRSENNLAWSWVNIAVDADQPHDSRRARELKHGFERVKVPLQIDHQATTNSNPNTNTANVNFNTYLPTDVDAEVDAILATLAPPPTFLTETPPFARPFKKSPVTSLTSSSQNSNQNFISSTSSFVNDNNGGNGRIASKGLLSIDEQTLISPAPPYSQSNALSESADFNTALFNVDQIVSENPSLTHNFTGNSQLQKKAELLKNRKPSEPHDEDDDNISGW